MSQKCKASNENSNRIQLITSDWSGVISDDRKPVYESNMRMLEAHGKNRISFADWLPRTTLTPIESFANQGIIGDPKALFDEYRNVYAQVKREGMLPTVYPDSKEVLKFLSGIGYPVTIISSHPSEHLIEEASEYGVKDHILSFLGNVTDKTSGLLKICLSMSETPSNAIYLGDTIYDIRAAKKAGVHSVGVATGYHVRERLVNENPDFVVDSLTEFQSTITKFLRK